MAYKIIRPASHDEWLEERKKGIGASDAGTVMGVSPFKTRTKLFMQKTGRLAPDPETPAMREGHWLEFATAAAFEELADAVVDPSTEGDWLAVDTKDEFLRVSPDRCWWPKDTPEKERTKKNWCVLELKSTNKPVDPDSLPMYWILQLQYQMGVMGAKKGALCWIDKSAHAGEPAFGYKMFDFKPNTYKNLKEALTDFWKNHILADVPPSADTGDDVALLYSATDPQKRTVAPQDLQESLTSYKALKAEADRLEKLMEETKDRIKTTMLDAELLTDATGRILATWKASKTKVFDKESFMENDEFTYEAYTKQELDFERLEKEHPEIVKQYTDTVQSNKRTLRIM